MLLTQRFELAAEVGMGNNNPPWHRPPLTIPMNGDPGFPNRASPDTIALMRTFPGATQSLSRVPDCTYPMWRPLMWTVTH
ncbi:hypothetical protein Asp14428_04620 [Actinoplanes sp. NBRC 14428]|nr:hypothetical protein Asp14428_04620 [Actinoplanes sp. NBRC 14428]